MLISKSTVSIIAATFFYMSEDVNTSPLTVLVEAAYALLVLREIFLHQGIKFGTLTMKLISNTDLIC